MISRRDSWIAGYALPLYGIAHPFVLFPLTPALSLGEWEEHPPPGDMSKAVRIFAAPALLFPLPEGEGQGEGEQGVRLLSRPDFPFVQAFKRPLARSG